VTANADDKSDSELATEIISLLGGAHNIDSVGSCITRLRLEVAKSDDVDKDGLNGLGARRGLRGRQRYSGDFRCQSTVYRPDHVHDDRQIIRCLNDASPVVWETHCCIWLIIGKFQGAVLKKVSIIDVAKQAGVSVSTVSLVLRQKGKISEATIEKVHAAINTLGYVHNTAAANLRANTSNLIGLILRDLATVFPSK
jgi:hypothetical protein